MEIDQENLDDDNIESQKSRLIQHGKLGSTILINTDVYLDLILRNHCSKCHSPNNGKSNYSIKSTGLSHVITVKCFNCKQVEKYSNQSQEMDFSVCMAGAGLVGGVNREELRTSLGMIEITTKCTYSIF